VVVVVVVAGGAVVVVVAGGAVVVVVVVVVGSVVVVVVGGGGAVVVVVVVVVGGGRGVVVVVAVVGGCFGAAVVVGSGREPAAGAGPAAGRDTGTGTGTGTGPGAVAGVGPGAAVGPVADVGPVVGVGPVVEVAGAATNVTPAAARVTPVGPVDEGDPTDVWRAGAVVVVAGTCTGAGTRAAAGAPDPAVGVVAAAVVGPEVVGTRTLWTPWLGSLGPRPPGEAMMSTPSNSPTTARPANVPARCEWACSTEPGAPHSSSTTCSAVRPAGSVPAPFSSMVTPFPGTGGRSLPWRKTDRDLETCGPARSFA
jgi:hypothetical protein